MQYNTEKKDLVIPEYGRHVHRLISLAVNEEDLERQKYLVEYIIDLMAQITPYNKGVADTEEKLWKHLFRMADYKLKVDPPEHIVVNKEAIKQRPKKLDYPIENKKNRHYGFYVRKMIEKAKEMEDEDKKDQYAEVIASYMKTAYRTYNRNQYVTDDTIKEDLKNMSEGELTLDEDVSLRSRAKSKRRKYKKGSRNRRHRKRS